MQIRETNLRDMKRNLSSISSEPLDLDLHALENYYEKRSSLDRKHGPMNYKSITLADKKKKDPKYSEIISGRYVDYGGTSGAQKQGGRKIQRKRTETSNQSRQIEINISKHYQKGEHENDSILSASKEDFSIVSSLSPERLGKGGEKKNKMKRNESPFLAFSDLGHSVAMESQLMTYGRGFREGSIVQTGRKASHQNSMAQNRVFNPSNSRKQLTKEKSRQEKRNNSEEK
jgi:hypothetical protein